MSNNSMGNYFLFYVAAFSGSFLTIYISRMLSVSKILIFLGRNSLIILGLHIPVKRFVMGVTSIILRFPLDIIKQSLLISFVDTMITILILVPIIYVINNRFFFITGRTKPPIDVNTIVSQ